MERRKGHLPSAVIMAASGSKLDAIWDDVDRVMGQLFVMGWEAPYVTPQIRSLIRDQHLGSILLATKNLRSAHETAQLVQQLQMIAHEAGHPVPLIITMDQENGGVNTLFDEEYISQFPSAMGMAATGDVSLAFDVAKATAAEVSAVGVNMILGPSLDVLNNERSQTIGVRATSDDPQETSQFSIATMKGYQSMGIATTGKHFPSYGSLDATSSLLDMPVITEHLSQLSRMALIPFANAINAGIDSIMVGGCAIANSEINVMHACLSNQVVGDLLRRDLGFTGVVISECMDIDALGVDIGVRGGTVMAIEAGCDLILLCGSFPVQQEAISGLRLGVDNDMLSIERIRASLRRILKLKSSCTSWEQALHPPGLKLLRELHPLHAALSRRAYDNSITVMRNERDILPLSITLPPSEELLLLTPLLKPLPASAASQFLAGGDANVLVGGNKMELSSIISGESTFQRFGRSLIKQHHGKLAHTSYTANGVRPSHEILVKRASSIIIITAEASRNLYQIGFVKHIAMLCSTLSTNESSKSLVVVSVSSPYDFARDNSIDTYVCTYDFTETALASLARLLFGEISPKGILPGSLGNQKKSQKSRQNWLVERWSKEEAYELDLLIEKVCLYISPNVDSPLRGATAASFSLYDTEMKQQHYMVRNSSTRVLYGFCSTYIHHNIGYIGAIFVDPSKRSLSIGHSLYQRATRDIYASRDISSLRIGIRYPAVFPGVPVSEPEEGLGLCQWLTRNDPCRSTFDILHRCVIRDLRSWSISDDLLERVRNLDIEFDLVRGLENLEDLVAYICDNASWETLELYRHALRDSETCGVVRAKRTCDAALVGTIILCRSGTTLATYVPFLKYNEGVGGILSPIISSHVENKTVLLQGLLIWGVRQNKVHKSCTSLLDQVDAIYSSAVSEVGFETVHVFEQLIIEGSSSTHH